MLNRKLHRASNRVKFENFALDGVLGCDMHGKIAGVIGMGKIGTMTCRLLHGFGCRVLAHDVVENIHVRELGDTYVSMNELLSVSDILTTLHAPLTPATHHAIIDSAIVPMKQGVIFINTSRGA